MTQFRGKTQNLFLHVTLQSNLTEVRFVSYYACFTVLYCCIGHYVVNMHKSTIHQLLFCKCYAKASTDGQISTFGKTMRVRGEAVDLEMDLNKNCRKSRQRFFFGKHDVMGPFRNRQLYPQFFSKRVDFICVFFVVVVVQKMFLSDLFI